jgi:hypothetical protein
VIVVWAASVTFVALSGAMLPFDWPSMKSMSTNFQLVSANIQILWVLVLIGVTFFVTRRRPAVDLAARAPAPVLNRAELLFIVGYAVAAQIVGYGLGRLIGIYPISLHLSGSVFGISAAVAPINVYAFVVYNFVVYAAIPYAIFRARGYSNEALSLKSANLRGDLFLIVVILVLESAFELIFEHSIFNLGAHQLLGTSIPIMVFIYAILLPRYLKLTGSVVSTVILGGVTYAALHLFEAWTLWDTPKNIVLSLIFLMFQYFGPGMVKSVLTVRTGNAWVHVWSYHSIAPHVRLDTPLIVKIFKIR